MKDFTDKEWLMLHILVDNRSKAHKGLRGYLEWNRLSKKIKVIYNNKIKQII